MENLKKIDVGSVLYSKTGCRNLYEIFEFIVSYADSGLKNKTNNEYAAIIEICKNVKEVNKLYE